MNQQTKGNCEHQQADGEEKQHAAVEFALVVKRTARMCAVVAQSAQ
jgi:hypothetical protein